MALELYVVTGLVAGGAGFAIGQMSGPVACRWPAKGEELVQRLLAVQLNRNPGALAKTAGALGLAALFVGGALTAYAAEPSAAQQLPKEARGVIGSGDQLSLQVRDSATGLERTLKVGDEYKDGWKLETISPTKATLGKDGQTEQVGLNPAGTVVAVNAPLAPATQVRTTGLPDQATLDKYQAVYRSRFRPTSEPATLASFSTAEIQRMEAYFGFRQEVNDRLNAEFAAGARTTRPTPNDAYAEEARLLGDAAVADDRELSRRNLATIQAWRQADLIASPPVGPDTYHYVPPAGGGGTTAILANGQTVQIGVNLASLPQAGIAAGLDPRGWWNGAPDGSGGYNFTRSFAPPLPSDPTAAAAAAAQAAAAKAAADRQRAP